MAKKTPIDQARVDAIAQAISGQLTPFRHTLSEFDDAKQLTAEARAAQGEVEGSHVNAREATMQALAGLAQAGNWSWDEVKAAGTAAAKGNQLKADKSIETFMGEAKLSMHPVIRERFAEIMDLRDQTWEAEQAAYDEDKNTPTPIKKAFGRKYHYLMAVLREAREQEVCPDTAEELVEFAVSKDPDLDAGKIKKRLDKIVKDLSEFYADFPENDIEVCIGFLQKIEEKHLVKARNEKLGIETPLTVVAATPVAAKPPKVLGPTATRKLEADAVVSELAAMAAGVTSIDDLMEVFDGSVH